MTVEGRFHSHHDMLDLAVRRAKVCPLGQGSRTFANLLHECSKNVLSVLPSSNSARRSGTPQVSLAGGLRGQVIRWSGGLISSAWWLGATWMIHHGLGVCSGNLRDWKILEASCKRRRQSDSWSGRVSTCCAGTEWFGGGSDLPFGDVFVGLLRWRFRSCWRSGQLFQEGGGSELCASKPCGNGSK